jgi:hypothetical protein
MSESVLPGRVEYLSIKLEPVWYSRHSGNLLTEIKIEVQVNGEKHTSTQIFNDLDDFTSRFEHFVDDAKRILMRLLREGRNQTDSRNGPLGSNPAGRAPSE